jgi:hypothetical protein
MIPDFSKQPSRPAGTTQASKGGETVSAGAAGSSEQLMELGTLMILAFLVGFFVLVRRWLMLRARKPHPGLPTERVLQLSPHTRLHDPKYLGRILDVGES